MKLIFLSPCFSDVDIVNASIRHAISSKTPEQNLIKPALWLPHMRSLAWAFVGHLHVSDKNPFVMG